MDGNDALSEAKLGSSLFVKDFPVKLRVLTLDPMVYLDRFGNTKFCFVVLNLDENKVQILDKTGGFANRFKEIHLDSDYGKNLRGIDLKITTNGESGQKVRYNINPLGDPRELTTEQMNVITDAKLDLEAFVKKNNPGALRLSEINAGKKLIEPGDIEDDAEAGDVVLEDIEDKPIDLSEIPF